MDTQNSESFQPAEQKPPTQAEKPHEQTSRSVIAGALVVGFLAGAAGGFFGLYYGLKSPALRERLSGGTLTQTVRLEEGSAVIDVVKKASPAVVSIVISRDVSQIRGFDPFNFFGNQQPTTPNIQEVGAGSGFFISSDGMILTNRHVVSDEQASYTVVTQEGQQYEATVLARDPVNDLALVKIEIQNAPTLELADSTDLQIGSQVVAIGNSLGEYQNTVTTGVISGIGRSIVAGGGGVSEQLEGVIQTDAAINPGNSGGPLLNSTGFVIGINTAVDQQGQLVGFAIPSNDARRAVDSYKRSGKIARPYLGIRYVIVTPAVAEAEGLQRDYGALILPGDAGEPAIISGSPASEAGLREGDIILSINDQRIDQDNTVTSKLKDVNPGDTIKLKVFRDGQEIDVTLRVGER